MANSSSNKLPVSGTVIYDSGNDTPTTRKRAVIPTGGVSVAERARLFGSQITNSSTIKNSNLSNQHEQRLPPPHNNRSTKSNVVHYDRNYQSTKTNVDRRPQQDTSYSTSQRTLNNRQQPVQINGRKQHEQSSSHDSRHYSSVSRSHGHHQHLSPSNRRPLTTHDKHRYDIPQKQRHNRISPTRIIISGESYILDDKAYDDPYLDLYNKQNKTSDYQQQSNNIPYQSSNYFQPIKDPLEEMFVNSTQGYFSEQIPMKNYINTNSIQPFELGNLIHRIQQDYMDNVRPYVSSIEYIETNQNFADIGYITPTTSRRDYTRRTNDLYRQKVPSSHYDIMDMNDSNPYIRKPSQYRYNDNQHSSIPRKYRRRYHDQASSPIHTVETSNKINKQHKSELSPAAVVPKASTQKTTSSGEEEESTTKKEKPTESETSSESSSESEDESEKNTSKQPSSQPVNGTVSNSITTGTSAAQRNDITRPTLPNQTASNAAQIQANKYEVEASTSDETDSDTYTDSDDDDDEEEEEPKPSSNIRTTPATSQTNTRTNNLRTTPATSQINTRTNNLQTTPTTSQTNTRSNNLRTTSTTPQRNAQLIQQRPIDDNYNTYGPPQSPNLGTNEFFKLGDSGKSSFGGKLKNSIKNTFRRNKS
ncbi:unnamed protein product [Rotaria sp. Silwood1]|nr:unnamed protein product [Rotaria sp. Silwood1]